MKILFLFASLVVLAASCSKKDTDIGHPAPDPPASPFPEMLVTELNDAEVSYAKSQAIDLNRDGMNDVVFATWYIGNPNQQEDEILYFAASSIETSLMTRAENNSPQYNQNDIIPVNAADGYDWFVVSQVELAMKNIGNTGAPYWEKEWKNASHKFLAVQVKKSNKLYYGWVELSMNTAQSKLVLHRAAISKEPARAVKAGI